MLREADRHRDALLALRRVTNEPSPRLDNPVLVKRTVEAWQRKAQAFVDNAAIQWKSAMICYEAALQLDPSLSYALVNEGVISLRMYDLDPDPSDREQYYMKAQGLLSKAGAVNKYDAQIIYYQAELKVRKQQWSEAEKLLKDLIAKGWEPAHAHNLLGWVYQMTGRAGLARDEWVLATRADLPPEANAWAIQKTRPAPKATKEEPRVPAATTFGRWEHTNNQVVPATAPSLPAPCYWLENGRTQC
jgi:tetratricopeptide (TPR) repeat protein